MCIRNIHAFDSIHLPFHLVLWKKVATLKWIWEPWDFNAVNKVQISHVKRLAGKMLGHPQCSTHPSCRHQAYEYWSHLMVSASADALWRIRHTWESKTIAKVEEPNWTIPDFSSHSDHLPEILVILEWNACLQENDYKWRLDKVSLRKSNISFLSSVGHRLYIDTCNCFNENVPHRLIYLNGGSLIGEQLEID